MTVLDAVLFVVVVCLLLLLLVVEDMSATPRQPDCRCGACVTSSLPRLCVCLPVCLSVCLADCAFPCFSSQPRHESHTKQEHLWKGPMTNQSKGRSLTEVVAAVTLLGFLTGFVCVLCVGNYCRAKRAMERQRQRRLAKLAGNSNGLVDSPVSSNGSERQVLLRRTPRSNTTGGISVNEDLLLNIEDGVGGAGSVISGPPLGVEDERTQRMIQ